MSVLTFHAPPLPYYIACGQATFTPAQCHPSRRSTGIFDLLLVKEGRLFMGEGEQQYSLNAGQALILRPDQYHYATQTCQVPTNLFWLHFQAVGAWSTNADTREKEANENRISGTYSDMVIKAEPFVIQLPQHCTVETPTVAYALLDTLLELEQQPQSAARWKQHMLFQSLLQELSRAHVTTTGPALQIAEETARFLRQHYRDKITYTTLKEALHFHPTYLARCMRNVFSCTPLEYLLDWRIEQAKHLLINTNLPVGEVAGNVGFHHLSYFIRCFMRREGVTPQVFRKQFHLTAPQQKTFRPL